MSITCKVRISKVKVKRKNSSYMSWNLKEHKATKIHIWITRLHVLRNHFKVTNLSDGHQYWGSPRTKVMNTLPNSLFTESQQPGYKVGPGQCSSGVVVVLTVKLIGSGRRRSALSRQFAVAADAWDVDLNLLVITESQPASASTWAPCIHPTAQTIILLWMWHEYFCNYGRGVCHHCDSQSHVSNF